MQKFVPEYGHSKTDKNNLDLPSEWTTHGAPQPCIQALKEEKDFSRARFDVHIYVQREARYYLINVCLFVWMFTQGTGVAFTFAAKSQPDKLSNLLTLLLTTVAYKIVVAGWLPRKPYSTLIDVYVLCCFVFQLLVIGYVVFENEAEKVEWTSLPHGAVLTYGCMFAFHALVWVSMERNRFLSGAPDNRDAVDCKRRGWLWQMSWQDVYDTKNKGKKAHDGVWPPKDELKPAKYPTRYPGYDKGADPPTKLFAPEPPKKDTIANSNGYCTFADDPISSTKEMLGCTEESSAASDGSSSEERQDACFLALRC